MTPFAENFARALTRKRGKAVLERILATTAPRPSESARDATTISRILAMSVASLETTPSGRSDRRPA